jgi:NTP pyrophosphatase (non-canonical NTP hydrolase)
MNLKEYQKETKRTFAYKEEPISETIADMLHCAIGISTEAAELHEAFVKDEIDIVNIGEEIADQAWYMSNLARFIKIKVAVDFFVEDIDNFRTQGWYINNSVKLAGELIDIFKRHIYYGKPLHMSNLVSKLKEINVNLQLMSDTLGLDFSMLLDKNIAKLRIRFPKRFTQEQSENRDLDAERKELEK